MKKLIAISLLCLFAAGCATYYQRNIKFQQYVVEGDMDKAEKYLDSDKKIQRDRNRILFLLNKGFIDHLQQEYANSNKHFNEADLLVEDYQKQAGYEALALVSNPEVKPYRVEDFESVFIHYYKALNYLNLRQWDAARVEARRINLKLQQLNDKYKEHKNRYSDDAFAHIIMGLSYEAIGEVNNAFIAYRNAYEVYTGKHGFFGIPVPQQLKEDLIRTAALNGFKNDQEFYEKEFNMKYTASQSEGGELVFFWHNGLGPVKSEWSVNFFTVPGEGGMVIFENKELGVSFPFYVGGDQKKKNDLLALRVTRVAFPKYVERPTVFKDASIIANGKTFSLDKAESVNDIAFKTLEDRFLREMGTSLLRLATKKIAEIQLSQQNEALGALATVANAVTEKADTRNWQTLPHTIFYTRVPLKPGNNEVVLKMRQKNGSTREAKFNFEGGKNKMIFFPYHSLDHQPIPEGAY